MDLDLEALDEELEGAGEAATTFLGILGGIPSAVSGAGAGIVAFASRVAGVGASFDATANRLRTVDGRFAASGAVATTTAQQLAQKIPAALSQVGAVASAVGGVVKSALTGDVRGALSSIGDAAEKGIGKLQDKLAQMGPYGAAAAAAIGVVETAAKATIGTLLDMAATAIKVTETRAGVTAAWAALAGGEAAGKKVAGAMGKLGDTLPFAGSQVRQWGESLLAAGVPAEQLASKVKAVAAAEALMRDVGGGGDAAAKVFKRLAEGAEAANAFIKDLQKGSRKPIEDLAHMGLSVKEVAKQLGMTEEQFKTAKVSGEDMSNAISTLLAKKGGGALDAMMNTWPVIIDKVKGGFMSLFGDLGPAVEPFMHAVKSLFGEFSKGGVAINILKPIVTAVFKTLFSWGTIAVNAIHKGFLMIAIGALMLYIKLRPVLDAIKRFATSSSFLTGLKTILIGIAIVAGLIAIPFILAGAAALLFVAVVGAVAAGVVALIGWIVNAVTGIATAIVDGISNFDGAAFIEKMKGLAASGLAAFKSILGIASPSKVLMEHGEEDIAGGAAMGVDKGGAKVDDAMSRLGDGPKGGKGGKGRAGAGGGNQYHFHYAGPASEAPSFFEAAARWLETLDAEAL